MARVSFEIRDNHKVIETITINIHKYFTCKFNCAHITFRNQCIHTQHAHYAGKHIQYTLESCVRNRYLFTSTPTSIK